MTTAVSLELTWTAYTGKRFETVYEAHAAKLGRRPAFTVLHGGDYARVVTTSDDQEAARAIIADLETN